MKLRIFGNRQIRVFRVVARLYRFCESKLAHFVGDVSLFHRFCLRQFCSLLFGFSGLLLGSMLSQEFDDFGVTFILRIPQGCPALIIFSVDVRTSGNKQFGYRLVRPLHGPYQGRFTTIVS